MKKYTADFETTTSEPAAVWLWGICEIDNPENWFHGESIDEFFEVCKKLKNPVLYFHNLKFDGSFLLHFLLTNGYTWKLDKKVCTEKDFTTIISDDGKFYGIEVYFWKRGKKSKKVTFYDSLKLLNMPVAAVAKAFGLKIKKGSIDYDRHNTPCPVADEEIAYLKNDVQIMALALQEMFTKGFTKMTIGSCALNDYQGSVGKNFKRWFPVLEYEQDSKIRLSYRGGYTFANPDHRGEDVGKGMVFDVNSLYPSVMAYRPLPYGIPLEFDGQYKPNSEYPLYIQNLRCFFKLKKNHIPTLQLKHCPFFAKTEYLTSSVNQKTGVDEMVDLCLTSVDLELFFKHYDVQCLEYVNGYMFKSSTKLFKEWVDKWNAEKVKADTEGNKGQRTIAKLMMNNLYGKFALNPVVESKYPYLDEKTNTVKYKLVEYVTEDVDGNIILDENGEPETTTKKLRTPIYIPVGTFITAWARYTTITASQAIHEQSINETGISRYCYSDTDSIHIIGTEIPDCIETHARELGKWKHESTFKRARFLQAKRYIEDEYIYDENGEHVLNENGEPATRLKITCAGMPDSCYQYVTWNNFKTGSKYKGKLNPKTVEGGIILLPIDFSMNEK